MTKPAEDRVTGEFNPAGRLMRDAGSNKSHDAGLVRLGGDRARHLYDRSWGVADLGP